MSGLFTSPHRPGICRIFGLVIVILVVFCAPVPVYSQSLFDKTVPEGHRPDDPALNTLNKNPDTIQILDTNAISAVPSIAVFTDPDRKLNVEKILQRYTAGDRPRSLLKNAIYTGRQRDAYWMVIPVINRSGHEQWVLDFSNRLEGRTAYFKGLFLYEQVSQKTLINTITNQEKTAFSIDHILPLTLPARKPLVLVMFMDPDPASPGILPLTIRPDLNDDQKNLPLLKDKTFYGTLLGLIAGFFLAASFLSRQWHGIAVIGYILSLSLSGLFSPQALTLTPENLLVLIPLLAPFIQNIFLLIVTFVLLKDNSDRWHNRLAGLITLLFLIIGATLQFNATPLYGMSIFNAFILLGAPLAVVFIALNHAQRGNINGPHLMAIGLFQFLATFICLSAENNFLVPPSALTLNADLFSIPLQVLFFAAALQLSPVLHIALPRKKSRERSIEDEERLIKLRNAKEGFDYNNLLKVIEHERHQLAEARDREMQRTEEMRRAKVMADEANRAKSAFLAVISHEIRTPMTGIMGMVKMLQDTTLTKDQNEFVGTIKESGGAMMSLLNDILDFEKIETGKLQLEHIDFDLYRLIQGVATLMKGHATTKGIQLTIDIAPDVPHYVIGDMARLRQVLLNLTGNAIKFTQEGSVKIRVSSTPQTGHDGKQHMIYFAVQDTGIGISRDAQKNIFNPFAQADSSISRKFGGSGLGLAISKRLIESMGSQINISSREGDGTTFFFSLKMPEGRPDTAPVEDIQNTDTSRARAMDGPALRILAIEDNEITQRVIRALLGQLGHDVTSADSGEKGLDILRAGTPFDLILCDIQMNGMTGYDFARQVRLNADPVLVRMPIVALTGNVDHSDIQKAYEAGMNDHLEKPIDPDRLNDILAAARTGHFRNTVQTSPPPVSPVKPPLMAEINETTPVDENYRADNGGFDSFAFALDQSPVNLAPLDSDTPEFQTDMLETLKESLGADQLDEMLDGLFDKIEEIITLLNLMTKPYVTEDIRARAHELKGMCGNFGLMALSKDAATLEKQAKAGTVDDLSDMIARLKHRYMSGRMAIDKWLKA